MEWWQLEGGQGHQALALALTLGLVLFSKGRR